MVSAVFGFFGSIVGLVATGVAAAAGLAFVVVAWKAGVLPGMVEWGTALITGGWGAVGDYFSFLGDLIRFAAS